MVINGKKLTVKFFLNKEVKGKQVNIEGIIQYPLYVRVTYNRSTTKFIAGNNWFPEFEESHLEENPTLQGVKSAIEKIVEYEVKNSTGDYKIAGLGDRVKTYSSNILEALNRSLIVSLENELGKVMPYVEFKEWEELPFPTKVKKGVSYLGKSLSNSIKSQATLAALLGAMGSSLSVYSWIMTKVRFQFIDKLRKVGKEAAKKKEIPEAFEAIPILGLDKEEGIMEVVNLIDSVCSQLLSLKYSSFVEAKSISYDEIEKIITVDVKKK